MVEKAICRAVLGVTLAAASAAYWAPLHAETRTANCTGDPDCHVEVSVSCGAVYCTASVNIDKLYLHGNNAFWDLDDAARTAGFKFEPVYGIWFKSLAGQKDFDCKPNGDTRFKCQNNSGTSTGKEYKYGVQIVGPKPVWLLDPWVVN